MSAVPADSIENSASFRDLGLSERCCARSPTSATSRRRRSRPQTIPVLLSGTRHARPGANRHRQDRRICAAGTDAKSISHGTSRRCLVLVPTRELALQVSEAFLRYAAHLKGFHVLPIYGGQSYQPQLNALRRGVHVVVGTPGRVIDHMNRGTLKLSRFDAAGAG